jgi:hypothetical protein
MENPLASKVSVRILHGGIDNLRLLLINNGPSRAFVFDGALCRVPTIKPGVDLNASDGALYRYPTGHEVAALYAVSFNSGGEVAGSFVEPGTTSISQLPRRSTILEDGRPFDTESSAIKGYCFVSFLGMDNAEDGAFVELSNLDLVVMSDALAKLPRSELVNGKIDNNDRRPFPVPEKTTR